MIQTESVADLLTRWKAEQDRLGVRPKSLAKRAARLQTALGALGGIPGSIERAQIVEHLNDLRAAGRSTKTIETLLSELAGFFRWAKAEGLTYVNPTIGIERRGKGSRGISRRRGVRALTPAEVARLIEAARTDETGPRRFLHTRSHLYTVAANTGLRLGQLTRSLRWQDVALDAPEPYLIADAEDSKNGGGWRIPLNAEAVTSLKVWRELCSVASDTDYVWGFRLQSDTFDADLKAGGIPKSASGRVAGFHSLRKAFCTALVAAGVAPGIAQKLMQHKDIGMTLRVYTELREEQLAEGVRRLPSMAGHQKNPAGSLDESAGIADSHRVTESNRSTSMSIAPTQIGVTKAGPGGSRGSVTSAVEVAGPAFGRQESGTPSQHQWAGPDLNRRCPAADAGNAGRTNTTANTLLALAARYRANADLLEQTARLLQQDALNVPNLIPSVALDVIG